MSLKQIPLSYRIQILLPSIFALLIVSFIGLLLFISTSIEKEKELRNKYETYAALAAEQFTAQELERIQGRNDMKSRVFSSMVFKLQKIKNKIPNAKYIYIFRKTDNPMRLEFIADADSLLSFEELDKNKDNVLTEDEKGSYPGDIYDISNVPALQQEAFIAPVTDKEVTNDQWGNFISSYAPIFDSSGNAVAVIGIDIDAKNFSKLRFASFPPSLLFAFVAMGAMLATYIFLLIQKSGQYRHLISSLMNNMPGMAFRCGMDKYWTMEFVSEGANKLTGFETADLIQNSKTSFAALIHQDDRKLVRQTINDAAEQNGSFQMSFRIHTKNGIEKWVSAHGRVRVSASNKVMIVEGFLTDITAQKHVEETKTQFLSAASHKLRTPLTGVRWSLEMLQQAANEDTNNELQKQLIQNAVDATQHSTDILDTMLRISTLESGRMHPNICKVNILLLIQEVCDLHKQLADKKLQTVAIECNSTIYINTDPKLMREIISTLIHNSIVYTENKGKISVHCKDDENSILIMVNDNGNGIPKHDQSQVFSKFFRAANAPILYPDGAGLNLYFSHSLAQLLGGTLTFSSNEGLGSKFAVYFPKIN